MEVKTYSPKMIGMTFGGAKVEGWNTITISRSSPSFTFIKGIRGKHTRVKTGDTSCTLTVNAPQTSVLNDIFDQIVNLDEKHGNGKLNISIRDMLGSEVFSCSEAYVEGMAERSYEANTSERSWIIRCMNSVWDTSGGGWGVMSLIDNLF